MRFFYSYEAYKKISSSATQTYKTTEGENSKRGFRKIANSPILKSAFFLRFCGIDSQMFDKFIRFDILNKFKKYFLHNNCPFVQKKTTKNNHFLKKISCTCKVSNGTVLNQKFHLFFKLSLQFLEHLFLLKFDCRHDLVKKAVNC